MTIDYNKHEYSKVLNYSNVLYEWHPTESDRPAKGWGVELHPKMQPFIHKLAMAHPDWTFVLRHGGSHHDSECKVNVHSTRVICEGEVIGTFELDTWKSGTPFQIESPSIKAARERGRGAWTTKPEKAYKLVEQNFRPRSIEARLKGGRSEVRGWVSSQFFGATRKLSDAIDKLSVPLAAYIEKNMDALKEVFPVQLHAQLEAIPAIDNERRQLDKIKDAANYNGGSYVMIRDGKYYVLPSHEETYTVMTSEELPQDMSAKLGMLKALDADDEVFEGVGVRTANGIYFIL